jgi:hypothetical protein
MLITYIRGKISKRFLKMLHWSVRAVDAPAYFATDVKLPDYICGKISWTFHCIHAPMQRFQKALA